jgi:hypothetical protein
MRCRCRSSIHSIPFLPTREFPQVCLRLVLKAATVLAQLLRKAHLRLVWSVLLFAALAIAASLDFVLFMLSKDMVSSTVTHECAAEVVDRRFTSFATFRRSVYDSCWQGFQYVSNSIICSSDVSRVWSRSQVILARRSSANRSGPHGG